MAELKMPGKGGAAAMLQELNAEEAPLLEHDAKASDYLTSKSVSLLDSQPTHKPGRKKVSSLERKKESPPVSETHSLSVSKPDSKMVSALVSTSVNKSVGRTVAEGVARKLGKGQMIAVGIKMPEDLSDYLDAAAFARKKQKVLKQDLIRRAIQLLVVELESGEELADLNG